MAISLPNDFQDVKLSTIKPDYADLRDQLNQILTSSEVWRDIIPSSTGEILIKFVAGIGAYDQFTIERNVQECFLDTARSPQNILTLARTLGVRLKRKSPSRVTVKLERTDLGEVFSIPKYSQFTIGGNLYFYNKDAIIIPDGTASIEVQLVEGRRVDHEFTSDGTAWQTLYVGSGFSSSDELTQVRVNGAQWGRMTEGAWSGGVTYAGEYKVYSDMTTQSGSCEIQFGNGKVGSIPPAGAPIVVSEYVVGGSSSNNNQSGIAGSYIADGNLKVTTVSTIAGGDDEPSASIYSIAGARAGRSLNRYVSRSDYENNLIFYPNVVDVKAVGEHEVGTDLTMMNVANIYILMNSPFSNQAEQDALIDFIYSKAMLGVINRVIYATKISIDVIGQLRVDPKYSLSDVYSRVVTNVNAFLAPKTGSIGKAVYRSDLHQVIMNTPGVMHFVMTSPTADTTPDYNQWVGVGNINISPVYGA